eukprot:1147430-Pelagomonas_calceolata.AAC.1
MHPIRDSWADKQCIRLGTAGQSLQQGSWQGGSVHTDSGTEPWKRYGTSVGMIQDSWRDRLNGSLCS